MKACIYGAGAIGGWLGVALAQAGCQISMVARGATLAALQADGLRLRRPDGTLAQASVTVHADPAALGVQDLVVIAVKAPGLPDVARAMAPLIGPDTIVLTAMCRCGIDFRNACLGYRSLRYTGWTRYSGCPKSFRDKGCYSRPQVGEAQG